MQHAALITLRCKNAEIGGLVESEKSAANDFPGGQSDFNRATAPVHVQRTDGCLESPSEHRMIGILESIKDSDRKGVERRNRT